MNRNVLVFIVTAMAGFAGPAAAQQADHAAHHGHGGGYVAPGDSGGLRPLPALPPSGAARETGFDGRHVMEPTSVHDSLAERCAKGSRGLIMLSNQEWARCGGKPEGWSRGPGEQAGAQGARGGYGGGHGGH